MKQASEGAESESGNIVYQRSLVQKTVLQTSKSKVLTSSLPQQL